MKKELIPNFDEVRVKASQKISSRSSRASIGFSSPQIIEEDSLVLNEDDVDAYSRAKREENNITHATSRTASSGIYQVGLIQESGEIHVQDSDEEDSEEEMKTDEKIAMDYFVEQQMKLSQSLDLSLRRNTAVDRVVEKQCYTCNSLMPPYVHHCSTCKKCVVFMDHHCPWVNNCVGFYTQKLFFLFNFYAILTFSYAIMCLTINTVHQVYGDDTGV